LSVAVQGFLKALICHGIVILLTALERAANFCVVADLRLGHLREETNVSYVEKLSYHGRLL